MNARLELFIRDALVQKISRDKIEQVLIRAGWRQVEITEALDLFSPKEFPVPVPSRTSYTYAHEAYKHLVMYFVLYLSMYSFGSLLFIFIDIAHPDLANASQISVDVIRIHTATLLIAFPLYALLHYMLWRSMRNSVERRQSKVRSWLTYMTMFIAACTFIGDLIGVVFNRLNGDLTIRFELRSAVIIGMAITVLGYYAFNLRRDEKNEMPVKPAVATPTKKPNRLKAAFNPRLFFIAVFTAFFTVVGGGIYYSSNPNALRSGADNDPGVINLKVVAQNINIYWSSNGSLPPSLYDLTQTDNFRDARNVIEDPMTHAEFAYTVLSADKYQICAQFTQPTDGASGGYTYPLTQNAFPPENIDWSHPALRTCYTLVENKQPLVTPGSALPGSYTSSSATSNGTSSTTR